MVEVDGVDVSSLAMGAAIWIFVNVFGVLIF